MKLEVVENSDLAEYKKQVQEFCKKNENIISIFPQKEGRIYYAFIVHGEKHDRKRNNSKSTGENAQPKRRRKKDAVSN